MERDEHDWERDRYLESLGLGADYWEDQWLRSLEYEMEWTVVIARVSKTLDLPW